MKDMEPQPPGNALPDEDDFPDEDEYEALCETTPLYTLEWGSDNPGAGAGDMRAYAWRGKVLVVDDNGEHLYPSLDYAILNHGLNMVTEATDSITSSALSTDEVIGWLQCWDENDPPRQVITVNGVRVRWQGEGFGRVEA